MAQYPLINGNRFDYSSVEINVNGRIIVGVKSISYSHKMEPGMVRGTSAQVNGRTRGQYEPDASMTLYKQEARELREALGGGYMEVAFDIVVHYQEPGSPVETDRIVGCRIKSAANEHEEGSDALVVKFELSVIGITENGVDPISNFAI